LNDLWKFVLNCTINCNNGNCSIGMNGNESCMCNENYDPSTYCLNALKTETPTWEILVIALSGGVAIILIALLIVYYKLKHKVNKVFEEVVIQDNIHASTELSSPKPTSAFIESSKPLKTSKLSSFNSS